MEHEHGENCGCSHGETNSIKVTIERRTDDELKQIANDLVHGRVFCDRHIHASDSEALISKIFMPLSMGALNSIPEEKLRKIGMIFEYIENDINNLADDKDKVDHSFPVFLSMQIIHADDMVKFMEYGQSDLSERESEASK